MKPEFDLIGLPRDLRDLESIPFAVCLLNLDGTYVYANPAYLDLVGVAEAGFGVLAGSPFDCGLADPAANDEMRRTLVDHLDHGNEYATVVRIRRGDSDPGRTEMYHRISARRFDEDRLLILTRPVLSAHDILLAERDEEIERLSHWRNKFLQNSPQLVISHDLDGIISFANAAAEEALGANLSELIGQDLASFVTPAYASRYFAYLEQLERRPTARGLLEVRGAYGETRSWRYQSSISIGDEDPPTATAQIADVTNEVQLLQALQESELRLHRLFAADERPIWIIDRTGLCIFANDAAIETTQPAWPEPTGVSIEQLLPGCDVAELLQAKMAHVVHPGGAGMRIMALDVLDLGDDMIRIAVVETDQGDTGSNRLTTGDLSLQERASVPATLAEMGDLLPPLPSAIPLSAYLDQIEEVARHLLNDTDQPEYSDHDALIPVAAALLRHWGTIDPPDMDAVWQRIDSALDDQIREPSHILRPNWPAGSSVDPSYESAGPTAAIVIASAIVSATVGSGDRTFEINRSDMPTQTSREQGSVSTLGSEPAAGELPPPVPNELPPIDLSDHGSAAFVSDVSTEARIEGADAEIGAAGPDDLRDQLRQNIWEIAGIEAEPSHPAVDGSTPDKRKSRSETDSSPSEV